MVEIPLWTWGGNYVGYRDEDDLWGQSGRLLGKFVGDEVYGPNGHYLGEIRSDDRLITDTRKLHKRRGMFGSRQRGMRGMRGMRGARGMVGGFKDFPQLNE